MTESIYQFLYDGLSMKAVGIAVGIALLISHIFALIQPAKVKDFLVAFPRSKAPGVILMILAGLWSYVIMSEIHMGEFFTLRGKILLLIPIATVLVILFVEEFLSVRALGTVMLLAAAILLHAAFLQPQATRLLLPILAYAWIIAGLFFVGMPYLMRDAITWVTKHDGKWNLACFSGIGYGALLLAAAIFTY